MSGSNAAVEGVAGALGACIGLFSTFPLQTIATRQAVSDSKDSEDRVRWKQINNIYFYTLEQRVQKGLSTYYHGIYPALLGTLTSQGVYFYVYSVLRELAQGKPNDGVVAPMSVSKSLAVASVAGSVNVLCTNPVWVAVTRMQTASSKNQKVSFFQEINAIYAEGGVRGLWKGTVPSLIMVANPTIQYMLYEWGAQWWRRPSKGVKTSAGANLTSIEVFIISAMAKLGATLLTYPLLVVKNRVQAGKSEGADGRSANGFAIIQQVWNQDGVFGFFKGMRAKIVQSVLGAAIMFVLKERLHSAAMRLVNTSK